MARLFLQYLANKNEPKSKYFAKRCSIFYKYLPNRPSKNRRGVSNFCQSGDILPKWWHFARVVTFCQSGDILPKWWHFAKSGHTALVPALPSATSSPHSCSFWLNDSSQKWSLRFISVPVGRCLRHFPAVKTKKMLNLVEAECEAQPVWPNVGNFLTVLEDKFSHKK